MKDIFFAAVETPVFCNAYPAMPTRFIALVNFIVVTIVAWDILD